MRFLSFRHVFTACAILSMTACCTAAKKPMGNAEHPYPLPSPPKVGDIAHLPTGIVVTPEQMLNVAADARIVYLGETHDNPASHRLELELLKGLSERHPGMQALGMEMFSPSQQPVLDRWVAGELDEKAFLKESHWFDQWKMDFEYYRDLLVYARDHKVPVIGLNAEKSEMAALRGKKDEELTAQEKEALSKLDFKDPYQRAMVQAVYGGHMHGAMGLDSFVRAQTIWDETMAESIVNYLNSPAGKGKRMLVIAGGNHISYGFGIPRRAFRRLPASYVLVGGEELHVGAEKQDRMMDVQFPEFPMVPYDFLAYLSYEDLPKKVKLGVQIEKPEAGAGVLVQDVVTGSSAEAAGIKKGDRILSIDGETVSESFDLVYAVQHKRPGEHAVLEIDRGGERKKLDVTLKEPGAAP
ncbi:ChaN family lipoprotein [Geomonas sp. RF6]|uniref:ChaN family lipoprotein n=1 Tax=Geomonas sp. RF6 TaxID=2897342 RepID=UPI001E531D5A|nr:ChaN family lipoprotein [Geomonas sp. RF6]UFS69078.1 ChaN family lipoprotein [Geomonas sp. RF6]